MKPKESGGDSSVLVELVSSSEEDRNGGKESEATKGDFKEGLAMFVEI